jgi:IstB-like ATP binding protein
VPQISWRTSVAHYPTEDTAWRYVRAVGRYGRLDLLLLDELGYVQIDPRGAELLFQVITEREEGAFIAIGWNLPFSEWGTVFPDPRLVAAVVDRGSRLLRALLAELGEQLVLVYTPTYDPNANRIEWLWRALRRAVTHTHQRQRLADLVAEADRWARTITPAQVLSQFGSRPRHPGSRFIRFSRLRVR